MEVEGVDVRLRKNLNAACLVMMMVNLIAIMFFHNHLE